MDNLWVLLFTTPIFSFSIQTTSSSIQKLCFKLFTISFNAMLTRYSYHIWRCNLNLTPIFTFHKNFTYHIIFIFKDGSSIVYICAASLFMVVFHSPRSAISVVESLTSNTIIIYHHCWLYLYVIKCQHNTLVIWKKI